MDSSRSKLTISIVVPCYNEELMFPALGNALISIADRLEPEYIAELILVDDGSRDATWRHISALAQCDDRIKGIRLSRNFGHQMALTCGYDLATGDAIVCMDADLQDPPEAVLEMVKRWQEGADVVYGIRARREGETSFKLLTAKWFYRLMRLSGNKHTTEDSGDFRLISRRSLDALNKMRERHRFIRGMVGWVGFRTAEVHYIRRARAAGVTKYNLRKMILFALDAMVSFSFFPLRISYIFASGLAFIFLAYLGYVGIMHFFFGKSLVPGWTSIIISIIAFGALNLFCLGIIGEYLGRIYEQSKGRPLYLIMDRTDENH